MTRMVKPWTQGQLRRLHAMSARRTPISTIAHMLKRTAGAVRQKAYQQGIGVGRFWRGVATSRRAGGSRRRLGMATRA